ncbi:hypothetical protein N7513_013165 [Penicillium frequentans]|nr:hypothetical protein N7513_013165 [Penicillium glabrum]
MARLTDLPTELLREIIQHVTYTIDLSALSQVNHPFHFLTNAILDVHLRQVFQSVMTHPDREALYSACRNGNDACVRRLLKAGIQVSVPRFGSHPIIIAAQKGHPKVVQAFLDYGVDPNPPTGFFGCEGSYGNPLTAAVKGGHESVVGLLIDRGVDLEFGRLERANVYQPLSIATQGHHVSLVKLLLDHGCNPHTPDFLPSDWPENSAWRIAAGHDLDILQMFIEKGAGLIFAPSSSLDPRNSYQWVLLDALRQDNLPLAKFLLKQGIRLENPFSLYSHVLEHVQKKDPLRIIGLVAGRNPQDSEFLLGMIDLEGIISGEDLRPIVSLMVGAISGGHYSLTRLLLDADRTSKCPTICFKEWKDHLSSCMVIAIKHGHINLVNLLLDYGADPRGVVRDLQTRDGYCPPVFIAAERGFTDILKLLLDRGANPFPRQPRTLFEVVTCHSFSEPSIESARLLVERDIVTPKTGDSHKVLAQAVMGGAEIFMLVVEHMSIELQGENPDHQKAMVKAVQCGDTIIIEFFLRAGFDPNIAITSRSLLALAAAGEYNSPGLGEGAVDLLIRYGADIEWRPPQHCLTPLFKAIVNGNTFSPSRVEAVRVLLRKGADPFVVGGCRRCEKVLFVEHAKTAQNFDIEVIKVFLEFFDESMTPFSVVEPMIKEIAQRTRNTELAELLWRWYWRNIYPCPKD